MCSGHVHQYAHYPARLLFHDFIYDRNGLPRVLGQKPEQLRVYADSLHAFCSVSHGLHCRPRNSHDR